MCMKEDDCDVKLLAKEQRLCHIPTDWKYSLLKRHIVMPKRYLETSLFN